MFGNRHNYNMAENPEINDADITVLVLLALGLALGLLIISWRCWRKWATLNAVDGEVPTPANADDSSVTALEEEPAQIEYAYEEERPLLDSNVCRPGCFVCGLGREYVHPDNDRNDGSMASVLIQRARQMARRLHAEHMRLARARIRRTVANNIRRLQRQTFPVPPIQDQIHQGSTPPSYEDAARPLPTFEETVSHQAASSSTSNASRNTTSSAADAGNITSTDNENPVTRSVTRSMRNRIM